MTADDPQVPFWFAIDAFPGEPGPRLRFADWCDENATPIMAEVQRWLADSGRRPMFSRPDDDLPVMWLADVRQGETRLAFLPLRMVGKAPSLHAEMEMARLPLPLFLALGSDHGYAEYPTLRAAEEALAVAWKAATTPPSWWARTFRGRRAWVPDRTPAVPLCRSCKRPVPQGSDHCDPFCWAATNRVTP